MLEGCGDRAALLQIGDAIDADETVAIGGGNIDEAVGDLLVFQPVAMQYHMRKAVIQQLRPRRQVSGPVIQPAAQRIASAPASQQEILIHIGISRDWRPRGPALDMGIARIGLMKTVDLGVLFASGQVDEMDVGLILFALQPVDEIQPALGHGEWLQRLIILPCHQPRQQRDEQGAPPGWQPFEQRQQANAAHGGKGQEGAGVEIVRRPEGLEELWQRLRQEAFGQGDLCIKLAVNAEI